ncbi:MAG: class I SAM-dependent methyltransferase [Bryobacteraceae bacterium]|nr:class I SAM-dependent methyltransferase [Bryobacteraceae bacterium]
MAREKFELQDHSYDYPYHFIPNLDRGGEIRLHRQLQWGLVYMTYMTFVADLIRSLRPSSMLDVGCGDARLIHMVKGSIPRVAGRDLSERAIAFAKAFNPEADIECADVAGVEAQFDVVSAIEVLEHIPDEEIPAFVDHLARRVAPGGALVIAVPTVNRRLLEKHYRHYDLPLLERTLAGRARIEQSWWLHRPGRTTGLITAALNNRLFSLNLRPARRWLWNLHKKTGYFATPATGIHLVALARPL